MVKALDTPLVEVKEDVLSKAKNGSPEWVLGLDTPLVEVKEDVLSKAKNGSPEWGKDFLCSYFFTQNGNGIP